MPNLNESDPILTFHKDRMPQGWCPSCQKTFLEIVQNVLKFDKRELELILSFVKNIKQKIKDIIEK